MGLVKIIKFSDFSLDPKMGIKDYSLLYIKNGISIKSLLINESIEYSIKSGRTPSKFNEDYWNGEHDFFTMQDIDTDIYVLNDVSIEQITDYAIKNEKTLYLAPKNSLVISNAMTIGLAFIAQREIYINQNVFHLNIDEKKVNKIFLKWYFNLIIRPKFLKVFASKYFSKNEFGRLKIPNISLNIQNNIVDKIKLLEDEIKNLKSKKQEHLEIINEVFSNYFDIDLKEIKKLEDIKQFNLPLISVTSKNSTLRASYKWHKLETIQSYIYKDIDCIYKLDKFIINMNNGWSPESSEIEEGTAILGQEHIQKDGKISLNASKFTTKTKNNIENFYIKQNDFFVSRGNTIDLVALASVVIDEVEEDILYPDLYIRVDFDKNFVNKEYMASLFNSFIGRIYFKHVAKGKNQTMVKVSSKELYDFYLPLPSLDIQEQIVKDIKNKIEEQDNIDKEIEKKQLEISGLIEDVIRECK